MHIRQNWFLKQQIFITKYDFRVTVRTTRSILGLTVTNALVLVLWKLLHFLVLRFCIIVKITKIGDFQVKVALFGGFWH